MCDMCCKVNVSILISHAHTECGRLDTLTEAINDIRLYVSVECTLAADCQSLWNTVAALCREVWLISLDCKVPYRKCRLSYTLHLSTEGQKRLKHDLDWQSTAESIARCFRVGEMDHLALWPIVDVDTFVIQIECNNRVLFSLLWKEIQPKQKGYTGDIRDSESWQLLHSLVSRKHLSDMAFCTVTH